jgi:ribosomal-protein-alanine N-acetyltransferase
MQASINRPRITLREFTESDRASFIQYQTDPRYLRLYDFAPEAERPSQLFDLFLQWQDERPREKFQLGIFDSRNGALLGSAGLRKAGEGSAIFGIELAPGQWGRFRLAIDAASAMLDYGFGQLGLERIFGDTASGNRRIAKLARWFGAELVAERDGPGWMKARGWREVDWSLDRQAWQDSKARLGEGADPA